ncbi:MAG: hypothetical protein AAGI90_04330 [Chlamydiota bacterium]
MSSCLSSLGNCLQSTASYCSRCCEKTIEKSIASLPQMPKLFGSAFSSNKYGSFRAKKLGGYNWTVHVRDHIEPCFQNVFERYSKPQYTFTGKEAFAEYLLRLKNVLNEHSVFKNASPTTEERIVQAIKDEMAPDHKPENTSKERDPSYLDCVKRTSIGKGVTAPEFCEIHKRKVFVLKKFLPSGQFKNSVIKAAEKIFSNRAFEPIRKNAPSDLTIQKVVCYTIEKLLLGPRHSPEETVSSMLTTDSEVFAQAKSIVDKTLLEDSALYNLSYNWCLDGYAKSEAGKVIAENLGLRTPFSQLVKVIGENKKEGLTVTVEDEKERYYEVQEFVQNLGDASTIYNEYHLDKSSSACDLEELQLTGIFDILTGNEDRNRQNLLFRKKVPNASQEGQESKKNTQGFGILPIDNQLLWRNEKMGPFYTKLCMETHNSWCWFGFKDAEKGLIPSVVRKVLDLSSEQLLDEMRNQGIDLDLHGGIIPKRLEVDLPIIQTIILKDDTITLKDLVEQYFSCKAKLRRKRSDYFRGREKKCSFRNQDRSIRCEGCRTNCCRDTF